MVVNDEIDFEISEFYRLWMFEKVENLMTFSKNVKIEEEIRREKKKRRDGGRTLALRVIRAETRLTVHRSLP